MIFSWLIACYSIMNDALSFKNPQKGLTPIAWEIRGGA